MKWVSAVEEVESQRIANEAENDYCDERSRAEFPLAPNSSD